MSELWCMRVIGPDEVHAMPSREAAVAASEAHDNAIRRHLATRPDLAAEFPPPWTVVEPWPWDAEAHAADMARPAP